MSQQVRAFSMAEIMVVSVIVGVFAAVGVPSLVSIVGSAKRNHDLAKVNLAVREQRALALEQRTVRFLEPLPAGGGLSIRTGTVAGTGAGRTCTGGAVIGEVLTPALTLDGDSLCFNEDGVSGFGTQRTMLVTGSPTTLRVMPAGTTEWTGTSLAKSFKEGAKVSAIVVSKQQ